MLFSPKLVRIRLIVAILVAHTTLYAAPGATVAERAADLAFETGHSAWQSFNGQLLASMKQETLAELQGVQVPSTNPLKIALQTVKGIPSQFMHSQAIRCISGLLTRGMTKFGIGASIAKRSALAGTGSSFIFRVLSGISSKVTPKRVLILAASALVTGLATDTIARGVVSVTGLREPRVLQRFALNQSIPLRALKMFLPPVSVLALNAFICGKVINTLWNGKDSTLGGLFQMVRSRLGNDEQPSVTA